MMLYLLSILLTLSLRAGAELHHLFASSYRSPHLFALEYNTETNSLTHIGNLSAHAGHPWLSFNHDKRVLYGAERDGWSSYRIRSPAKLEYQSSLALRGRCEGGNFKSGTTSLIAQQRQPYNIYGAARSPCGNVLSSGIDGRLDRVIQNITFQSTSRVSGMALDPANEWLYMADVQGNGIWAHKIDAITGKLSQARFTTHNEANARPRRLAIHPTFRYLYVMLSKLNKVAVYSIGMNTLGQPILTPTGQNYSIVPPGTWKSVSAVKLHLQYYRILTGFQM